VTDWERLQLVTRLSLHIGLCIGPYFVMIDVEPSSMLRFQWR